MKMWQKSLIYVTPNVGWVLMAAPLAILGGIYAKYFGLSLATIGTVMLFARLSDAFTDPLVGYYSDRQRQKTGTRKPFILTGAIAFVPCSYFLLVPPENVSVFYFTFWYMALYLAMTIFSIPYMAWANEFTETSEDKTLVFSMAAIVSSVGGAMFYVLPLLPFFVTTEITPQILKVSVLSGVVFFIPGILLALKVLPSGPAHKPLAKREGEAVATPLQLVRELLAGLYSNKPFVLYLLVAMCSGIGVGMWIGLFFIYVDTFLRLGPEFAELSMWGMVMGIVAVPIWYRLAIRWGKRKTWLIGMVLLVLVFFGTSLLEPGAEGFAALFALNMLMTFAGGSGSVVLLPMLCDVIDYGRLKDGAERSAIYFSINGIMAKVQIAIGSALGFVLVGWFGFDMQVTEQTEWAIAGMRLGVAWVPMFFFVVAIFLIARMPLTEERMKVVRRRLKMRDERLQHTASF
jgi:Na+/melibiose symporter-like transporter